MNVFIQNPREAFGLNSRFFFILSAFEKVVDADGREGARERTEVVRDDVDSECSDSRCFHDDVVNARADDDCWVHAPSRETSAEEKVDRERASNREPRSRASAVRLRARNAKDHQHEEEHGEKFSSKRASVVVVCKRGNTEDSGFIRRLHEESSTHTSQRRSNELGGPVEGPFEYASGSLDELPGEDSE